MLDLDDVPSIPRVAVIGAGAAGLTAALALHGDHDVTLFEAAPRAGGHAWTIDVDLPGGPVAVDVGFLVLNDRNYPNFEALLAELGVETRASDMSFSVSDGAAFEYAGHGANGLFANRRHLVDPRFLRMIREYARFNRDARALLASDDDDPSLRVWLTDLGYSQRFIEGLIVPQASAVWSADPEQLWDFPARFLAQFFDHHGMLGFRDRPTWRTVVGGSRTYVEAITARLGDRVRLATPIEAVVRTGDGVLVVPSHGQHERFDEVILACHSDQALDLLADPTRAERDVLGAIRYLPSRLQLHSDRRLLPRRRAAWASWNYHLLDTPPAAPTVTYHLNRLQGVRADRELLATLNLPERVDPATVHADVEVAHPVFSTDAVAAQQRRAEISGVDGVHYAGAYWRWGFHEDAVVSGLDAAAEVRAAATRGEEAVAA
ncbi:MAG TPA: FAD-dependent oxidoreductase [Baekduia sp.]|nr:FAD-dependent oxidoreductase [Baekduia sp.]